MVNYFALRGGGGRDYCRDLVVTWSACIALSCHPPFHAQKPVRRRRRRRRDVCVCHPACLLLLLLFEEGGVGDGGPLSIQRHHLHTAEAIKRRRRRRRFANCHHRVTLSMVGFHCHPQIGRWVVARAAMPCHTQHVRSTAHEPPPSADDATAADSAQR